LCCSRSITFSKVLMNWVFKIKTFYFLFQMEKSLDQACSLMLLNVFIKLSWLMEHYANSLFYYKFWLGSVRFGSKFLKNQNGSVWFGLTFFRFGSVRFEVFKKSDRFDSVRFEIFLTRSGSVPKKDEPIPSLLGVKKIHFKSMNQWDFYTQSVTRWALSSETIFNINQTAPILLIRIPWTKRGLGKVGT